MKLEEMKNKICFMAMASGLAHNCIGKLCMACKEDVHPEYFCAAISRK